MPASEYNQKRFSSNSNEWPTPQYFFDRLNEEFSFTLDPCADSSNAKCARYFTQEEDGLTKHWDGVVFMNPPYGDQLSKWMRKAFEESRRGATVVCVVPSRTDAVWWHTFAMRASEIRFVKGRLSFGDSAGVAPFATSVVIFRPGGWAVSSYPSVTAY